MSNEHIMFDMGEELISSPIFAEKCRNSEPYAQALYAALCNTRWQKIDVTSILRDDSWDISWRGAGRIVSTIIHGKDSSDIDYMEFYLSGMTGGYSYEVDSETEMMSVNEGTVVEVIREDLLALGWHEIQ